MTLITFEGIEGSGKSTQVELLGRWLADRHPVLLREPGGTEVGESVRRLLLHQEEVPISPQAELYLFLAARAELVEEVVNPALEAGRVVILDRYHDSTLAYQGGARGLDVGDWPPAFPKPDVTFLLELPAEAGLARRQAAGGENRIDAEELAFHQRVAAAYDRLAAAEPERFARLDATASPDTVQE
ncbi:MAG TPA: dTMP kinase, partial [Candidatus Dormibacteraeota bacterium]